MDSNVGITNSGTCLPSKLNESMHPRGNVVEVVLRWPDQM